ncbi:hypothetical protein BpHYR1_025003 [Brachionus plicatilis]|uniref:Uncharacterized protein n=1 Tax=Brachionus plicatilis TaxID=10195 RepID=A0A3M7RZ59_BRAPC|nr:hypothetical protein BpHYR1_025003 [Brachionus plicatilis]
MCSRLWRCIIEQGNTIDNVCLVIYNFQFFNDRIGYLLESNKNNETKLKKNTFYVLIFCKEKLKSCPYLVNFFGYKFVKGVKVTIRLNNICIIQNILERICKMSNLVSNLDLNNSFDKGYQKNLKKRPS